VLGFYRHQDHFCQHNDVALLLRIRMLADARNHKQLRLELDPTAASAGYAESVAQETIHVLPNRNWKASVQGRNR
jgi:hypothetical protein